MTSQHTSTQTTTGDGATLRSWLEMLFVANIDAVFNVAYRVLWNHADAEDVVQATFIKALGHIGQLRDPGRIRPWLLQVSYREAITMLRARRDIPTNPGALPEHTAMSRGPAEHAVASEVTVIVTNLLEQMETNERIAVVLRDVEQLSMKEVAEVLGIGLSATKMRVQRGRASLRVLVNAAGVR